MLPARRVCRPPLYAVHCMLHPASGIVHGFIYFFPQNAVMAQSPVVLLGGAAATLLAGPPADGCILHHAHVASCSTALHTLRVAALHCVGCVPGSVLHVACGARSHYCGRAPARRRPWLQHTPVEQYAFRSAATQDRPTVWRRTACSGNAVYFTAPAMLTRCAKHAVTFVRCIGWRIRVGRGSLQDIDQLAVLKVIP